MKKCRACLSSNFSQIIDFGPMPLAGGFLGSQDEFLDEELYPLSIHFCNDCSLVQILDPVDPSILFSGYSFSSSTIPALVSHFSDYADYISEVYSPISVFEFGCNDGILLEQLTSRSIEAYGVDASDNIAELAKAKGLNVDYGFFGEQYLVDHTDFIGKFDFVTASNTFPHNSDPDSILSAAVKMLNPNGYLALEIMYAGDLVEKTQWDTLYHEHLTFYSLQTLTTLLQRHNLSVIDVQRLDMHGGSIRVVASQGNFDKVNHNAIEQVQQFESDINLNELETWESFSKRSKSSIDICAQGIHSLMSSGNKIWGYGAAGKATMWVNACKLKELSGFVDASPLRAGKFMPGTHTKIHLPSGIDLSEIDYFFVTAWNYLDSIRAQVPDFKGKWIVPLPEYREL